MASGAGLEPGTPGEQLAQDSRHGHLGAGQVTRDKSPPDGAVPSLYSRSLSHSVRQADTWAAQVMFCRVTQWAVLARVPHGWRLPALARHHSSVGHSVKDQPQGLLHLRDGIVPDDIQAPRELAPAGRLD